MCDCIVLLFSGTHKYCPAGMNVECHKWPSHGISCDQENCLRCEFRKVVARNYPVLDGKGRLYENNNEHSCGKAVLLLR